MQFKDLHLHWRTSSYKGKKYFSYSLAKSIWTNGTCRKKIILKLGKLSDEQIDYWKKALRDAKKQHSASVKNQETASSENTFELTNASLELDTRDLTTYYKQERNQDLANMKKFTYEEIDKNRDIQSCEDAVKYAFAEVDDPRVKERLLYPFYGVLLNQVQ